MTTTKKTTTRKPRTPAKPKPIRERPVRTKAERKAKAIELCLRAIAGGWTVRKFCHWSKVSRFTMLPWLAEETVLDRYTASMRVKALSLPDEAMEIVKVLRAGGEWAIERVENPAEGQDPFKRVWNPCNPKALGVALRHIEFRMQREIKAFANVREVKHTLGDMGQLTDDAVDKRFNELMEAAQNRRQIDGQGSPPAGKVIELQRKPG